jgi:hypothetical protein
MMPEEHGHGRLEPAVREQLRHIVALPEDWPLSGSLKPRVLERLAHHASRRRLTHSVETGAGKSTLLLSHLSARHTVFAKDDAGDGDSLAGVQSSPLLRADAVEFVVGPTQVTLRRYPVPSPLQLVMLDGPHGFPFPQLEYYFLYPHLAEDGVLVLDDVHIRTVNDLFRFVRADRMFELLELVHTTAFFRRTDAPVFDPQGDGWWLQRYNQAVFPPPRGLSLVNTVKACVPLGLRNRIGAVVRRLSMGRR